MKKLACVMLATAFSAVASGQAPSTSEKAVVISSLRHFVKSGHEAEYKAAAASHVQKFHKGETAVRVYEVISGPDSGAYHLVIGPTTWTALDDRKMGDEHDKDLAKNVLPHLEKEGPMTFATFSKTLSTVEAGKFSEKAVVRRYTVRPGMGPVALEYFNAMKPVWEKQGRNVAIWQSFGSGESTYSEVSRLKNGFKDFDADMPTARKVLEDLVGKNEYNRVQGLAAVAFSQTISELIVFKPELSSK